LTATRGTAIIDSVFDSYRPRISGEIQARDKGSCKFERKGSKIDGL
jgi:GTP-binding protein